jgi:hypothetical protein
MDLAIVPWRDRSKVILDDSVADKARDAGDNSAKLLNVTVVPEYQLTVP